MDRVLGLLRRAKPQDSSIQAEYADGHILDETALGDVNPYGDGNVFTAIVNGQAELEHGPLVRLSCFWAGERIDVDWASVPAGARPVRLRHGFASMNSATGERSSGWLGVDFGWETDLARDVRELR